MNLEYRIRLLEEEKEGSAKKHWPAYDKDIKKLLSFKLKIDKLEQEVELLKSQADSYWNGIC